MIEIGAETEIDGQDRERNPEMLEIGRERENLPDPTEEQLIKMRTIKAQQIADIKREEDEFRMQQLMDKESRLRKSLQEKVKGQTKGGEADDEFVEEEAVE